MILVDEYVAKAFTDAFKDMADTSGETAESMTCTEIEAFANMLAALGYPQCGEEWIAKHAEGDGVGDMHCPDEDESGDESGEDEAERIEPTAL